jgi:hypothetical protein
VVAVAASTAALAAPTAAFGHPGDVTVASRNLYLGADVKPMLTAIAQGSATAPSLVASTFTTMQRNDFPARAQAIAGEVAATRPDVVGVQELARWYTGPFGDPATATDVAVDYLPTLLGALAARGLHYAVAAGPTQEYEIEAPATFGADPAAWRDVRLVLANVILVRTDRKGLTAGNPQSGEYSTQVKLGGEVVHRNWESADVHDGAKAIRFFNTHLEAFVSGEPTRVAEAKELASGPLRGSSLPVVLGCDCNSVPGTASGGAYAVLTDAAQGALGDAWTLTRPGEPGATCCQPQNLHNVAAFTQRADLVLTSGRVRAVAADLVGESVADRIAPGLWPSDHAGILATVRRR